MVKVLKAYSTVISVTNKVNSYIIVKEVISYRGDFFYYV